MSSKTMVICCTPTVPMPNAYILKPFAYKDLSRLVRRMVRFWEMVEIPEPRS